MSASLQSSSDVGATVEVGASVGATDGVTVGVIEALEAVALQAAKCELCGVLNVMQNRHGVPEKHPTPPLDGQLGASSPEIPTLLSPGDTWSAHDAAFAT